MALIAHENNEGFINRNGSDATARVRLFRSSCLLIEGNTLIKCRRSLESQISRIYQINGR